LLLTKKFVKLSVNGGTILITYTKLNTMTIYIFTKDIDGQVPLRRETLTRIVIEG